MIFNAIYLIKFPVARQDKVHNKYKVIILLQLKVI